MKRTLLFAGLLIFTASAWYVMGYNDGRNRGFRLGVDATIAEVERQAAAR